MDRLRKCQECGAEYTPNRANQKYCSEKCYKKAKARRDMFGRDRSINGKDARAAAHALVVSQPVPLVALMTANRKPKNTSAVRWRIELRRRQNPGYYALMQNPTK